jgi:hypothetical protein
MRRLRDREVRVEEDKIVQVDGQANLASTQQESAQQSNSSAPSSSQIPPVDRDILNHAATDFSLPEYPDQEQQYAASPSTDEPIVIADEFSDQFSAYNFRGTHPWS